MIELETQGLQQWADCRNTSEEVAEAILFFASSEEDADRIWADPTDGEVLAVWEYATNNGLHDDSDLYWGIDTLAKVMADYC